MIDCERALEAETVYAYIDGAVEERWWRELHEHYQACSGCRCVMESERRIKDGVRNHGAPIPVPESLYRKTARIFDNA